MKLTERVEIWAWMSWLAGRMWLWWRNEFRQDKPTQKPSFKPRCIRSFHFIQTAWFVNLFSSPAWFFLFIQLRREMEWCRIPFLFNHAISLLSFLLIWISRSLPGSLIQTSFIQFLLQLNLEIISAEREKMKVCCVWISVSIQTTYPAKSEN